MKEIVIYEFQLKSIVKALRLTTVKADAVAKLASVISMIDKLAKRGVIHKNKASNLKSKLAKAKISA